MTSQALRAPSAAVRSGRWLRRFGALQAEPSRSGQWHAEEWQVERRRVGKWSVADIRRCLQLVLAGIWLLDAVLQFQAFMFTKGFAKMLAASSAGNPAIVAGPINWTARFIGDHGTPVNAIFAVIQLLIALGIAWRPTVRLGLAASVAWAVGIWWFGEGLGGVVSGTGSPLNGAPGAVIIYGLLAILLWPARRDRQASFAAGLATGAAAARALWLVLWGSLAYLALQPATAAAGAMSSMIASVAAGQPSWLAWTDSQLAAFLLHHGPATAIAFAIVLAVIAIGVYLPPFAARTVLIIAIVTATAFWIAEGLGGMLTGGGTDPSSGPLLALVALAFWPVPRDAATLRPHSASFDSCGADPSGADSSCTDLRSAKSEAA
jgi:hypothetical protein